MISELVRDVARLVAPPPSHTVSQWADAERRLSSEASAEPGRWKTSRAPYQKDILDAVNNPAVDSVVVMSSAQVGKTEILLNIIGYYIDFDPAPILLLQPTLEMAQCFSKDRLAPMMRDTPALKGKIKASKAKDTGNTILHKVFPGGHITMSGANSPAQLASRPIRILLADEVDRFPVSAGTEGDPFNLAKKRTTTFWNKKILAVSTPTVAGASRIESLYDDSTKEQYFLSCPACTFPQPLIWSNITFDRNDDGEPINVGHCCESCGVISSQVEWLAKQGEWVARRKSSTRGFHLNELISPWRRWPDIVSDFLEAKKSPETLKTFVNTSLGETWQEEGEGADHAMLHQRREHYAAEVPAAACVLTAAVDVQDDRLEIGVEAWGEGEENFKVDYQILRGNPAQQDIWNELDEILNKKYEHESGALLPIACTTIDSGGHFTQEVYRFVRSREFRRVYAIKGSSKPGGAVVGRPSKSNLGKVSLFSIATDTAKEGIYSRLKILDVGPGHIHFPIAPWCDEEYFAQLAAEQCVTKYTKGVARRVWKKIRPRNEAIDVAVYNLAALCILNPNFKSLSKRLGSVVSVEPEKQDDPHKQMIKDRAKTKRRPAKRKGGFVNSWR